MKRVLLLATIVVLAAAFLVGCDPATPPPTAGYFTLKAPTGNLSTLPTGAACKSLVHGSSWEPRPVNQKRNLTVIDPTAWHNAVAARPYDSSWHNWNQLRNRVDGQYLPANGTTDEIFQWAACKWGLPDNVLRAVAYHESTWYQYLEYKSPPKPHPHVCVYQYSCGDIVPRSTPDTTTYCRGVASLGGYDYQRDYSAGVCPETFSIMGIKSWEDPAWGPMAGNQNGTFPFNRNSTAFAVDYYGSYIRGCYEGWITWLHATPGTGMTDLWSCVGSWYSGGWNDSGSVNYVNSPTEGVKTFYNARVWLGSGFADDKPSCLSASTPTCGADTL